MKAGSVVVDVAIDRTDASKPRTRLRTLILDGVIHYCVANMPGAVSRTSSFALNNATLTHGQALADLGWKAAIARDLHLRNGPNVCLGRVTHQVVASDLGYEYVPAVHMFQN